MEKFWSRQRLKSLCLPLVLFGSLLISSQAWSATITVTNTSDSGAGSLRQAIADANSGDTINFSLAYPAQITVNTRLDIHKNLVIDGPGIHSLRVHKTISDPDPVFQVNSLNINVTIRGLTISGGNAGIGGGIYAANGNLRLENCRVTQNSANLGGGVAVANSASLTAVDTEISHNTAGTSDTGSGGGIYVFNQGSLSLERVTVINNTCGYSGGGIDLSCPGTVTITDSTIADNTATKYGGGIYFRRVEGDGKLVMTDCEVSGNTVVENYSGGLVVIGAGLEMTRCLVSENQADDYGGGLYAKPVSPAVTTLRDCTFLENKTLRYSGGGAYLRGSDTLIDGCLFQGNDASSAGGGISINHGTIKNTTFRANTASGLNQDSLGGGIWVSGATGVAEISSCLFDGNHADGLGGGIYIYQNGTHTITNTTLQGNTASGCGGGGLAIRGYTSGYTPTGVALSYVTVTGNIGDYDCTTSGGAGCESDPGGGVFMEHLSSGFPPTVTMKGCVVAENRNTRYSSKPQWYGELSAGVYTSAGYNFIARRWNNTLGFTNGVNNDQVGGADPLYPKLMALADNGGPTHTRMPEKDSPLVNAGGPATDVGGNPVTTDQRGKRRPVGSACDIGAVERDGGSLTPIYMLLFD
ncbi:MAG: right-handed parallel beta-helix repeat-containing protein [Spartobacteria bacterium]|nr:right-handed parallel beta-helix repeat-containing protein [Spartobacteria bacterium]